MGMVVIQTYILVSKLKKIKTEFLRCTGYIKIVSEYDQEISQSQTADNPVEPRGRAA